MAVRAIANPKGGCAKTTTTVHLAETMGHLGRKVVVVDADAQASARRWHRTAAQLGEPLAFDLEFLPTPDLVSDVVGLADRYDEVLIDVGPGAADIMLAAISVSDFVVIPLNAREDDRQQTKKTHIDCTRFEIPHAALISRVKTSERTSVTVTRGWCRAEQIPVFETVIYDLVAIGDAFGARPDPVWFAPVLAELERN
jgi:chromosome partitioning protein